MSPFLYTGQTCADFQSLGKVPLSKDVLNKMDKGQVSDCEQFLRIQLPMLSGPVDLANRQYTSSSFVVMCSIPDSAEKLKSGSLGTDS